MSGVNIFRHRRNICLKSIKTQDKFKKNFSSYTNKGCRANNLFNKGKNFSLGFKSTKKKMGSYFLDKLSLLKVHFILTFHR